MEETGYKTLVIKGQVNQLSQNYLNSSQCRHSHCSSARNQEKVVKNYNIWIRAGKFV